MIVKIPVYFELTEKLTPEQITEVQSVVQGQLTRELIQLTGRKFQWMVFGRRLFFEILSHEQVKNRITGPKPQNNT